MTDDGRVEDAGQERDNTAGLPRHLAALVGALSGPSDLGRNHDKYLSEITPHDYRRIAELLTTYSSLRLQVVDACVIALAERLDLHEVAALDRRDFQVVAPRRLPKGQRLKLPPED